MGNQLFVLFLMNNQRIDSVEMRVGRLSFEEPKILICDEWGRDI